MTTQTTRKTHAARSTTAPAKRTRTVELDATWAPVLDELTEVSAARKEAEDREKQLKDLLLEATGLPDDKDETILVRVAGKLRRKVSLRSRDSIPVKECAEAFPEAYDTLLRTSVYGQIGNA